MDSSSLVREKPAGLENEQDSELSEPDSTVQTPPPVEGLAGEAAVVSKARSPRHATQPAPSGEDEEMADADDETSTSHYPKRKRTSIFNDLSERKIEIPTSIETERTSLPGASSRITPRNSLGGVKGVLLGHWRDSQVPELENKHAVIGFIDVRERLRTRIQPINKDGDTISSEYSLPPGPGGSWVTFDRIYFSEHLIGLDHYQVKEYVRLRSSVLETTDQERVAAEKEAVKEATVRGREILQNENPIAMPLVARGAIPLDMAADAPNGSDAKRRKTSSSFVNIAPHDEPSSSSQHYIQDPLHGTRPTRIVLGYWRGSSEADPSDRHAVYGILGQNDMFRVKVVRETRDGRYVDGNFPSGAGALWIHYEEVVFEPHLTSLSRPEVKEYCRIRQYQIDHGETTGERSANEARAAKDALTRATAFLPTHHLQGGVHAKAYSRDRDIEGSPGGPAVGSADGGAHRLSGGHELRQLRNADARPSRHSLNDILDTNGAPGGPGGPRVPQNEVVERADALVRREIARVEAAQGRADAIHRERGIGSGSPGLGIATPATAGPGGAPSPPLMNGANGNSGRPMLYESEHIERLNRVWARQESLRLRTASQEAKIYDGVKYERKPTGPFMGKLVSQGTIITIDGEDYVEYRVLTKPSFF